MTHQTIAILCIGLMIAAPLAFYGFIEAISAIFGIFETISEKRKAKRAPSYMRVYDRNGNRIK